MFSFKEKATNVEQGYQSPQMKIFESYNSDVFTLTIGGNGDAQISYDSSVENVKLYGRW